MPTFNANMMRQVIMDHYDHPLNKREPKHENYKMVHMHSSNCIDDINVYLDVQNGKVVDACFTGIACTISTASTDIMCDLVTDKGYDDALYIIEQYKNMIFEKEFDEDAIEDAVAFINTSKQAARIKCATIGWDAAEQIINEEKK